MDFETYILPGYYWLTLFVSFYLLLNLPSKLDKNSNFYGSFILSAFGFVLWPVFVIAFIKGKKNGN